jgi:hypothetical protein
VKRLHWVMLSVVFIFIFAAPAFSDGPTLHPVMHPDEATRQRWIDRYRQAPLAHIEPRLSSQASAAGSVDLRSHLAWNSSNMSQRNQLYCGNCWVWSGTGVMEVALDVQNGIKDRLSEQFLNSCRMGDNACCGGWLYDLVDFYDPNAAYGKGFSIPWSNSGANWQDGWRSCDLGSSARVCNTISTSPQYAVSSIADVTIPTQGVASSTAIDNVKNVLNQNKAVWFGFFMPTDADWTAFDSFWANQPESTVWTPNVCGQTWNGGGGHAVLCVGYNDADPSNRYWVMLNSWGVNSNRPNGLFRVSMDMSYGCKDAENKYTFYFQTLDVTYAVGSSNHAPDVPSDPSPVYGATDVAPGVTLSWIGGDQDLDTVTYRVVLDTTINNPTTQICSGSTTSCATGALAQGTDYYWRVYATDEHGASATGPVWHFRTTDAWNDDFDQALIVPRVPYAYTEDTTAASPNATQLVSDDPSFTCGTYFVKAQGSHSVWFRYAPAAAGVITATTQGSDYDTVLAVWTGLRGALQPVACNDDVDLSDRWSRLQIPASAGTTYYIEVVDYYAASSSSASGGTLKLALLPELNRHGFVPIIMKSD